MSFPKEKVIFILGTTGVGKTKLSVQLAKEFNGEIVNADIMQMYDAVPIATAKVTPEEADGIPHHLLSFLKPNQTFTVRDYRDQALKVITDISSRGKLPIVVGGTNYYIQSLLWESLLDEGTIMNTCSTIKQIHNLPNSIQLSTINSVSSEDLYKALKIVDSDMAESLHMNQRRKVRRALEVYATTGRKQSDIIREQNNRFMQLESRYNNRCIYLTCERETLYKRLDSRVDKMVEQGLLEEVSTFFNENKSIYKDLGGELDDGDVNNHGIMQAIGLKEFIPYYCSNHDNQITIESCLEQLKQNTRNYAKRQITWIRNRLMTRNIYIQELDTTQLNLWEENVHKPAQQIVEDLLQTPSNLQLKNTQKWIEKNTQPIKHYQCTECNREFCGEKSYKEHMASRKHKRCIEHMKKKEIYSKNPIYMNKMKEKELKE